KLERLLIIVSREVAVAELGARELADAKTGGKLHVFVEDVGQNLALERHQLLVLFGGGSEALGSLEPGIDLRLPGGFANAAHRVGERASGVALLLLGDDGGSFEQTQPLLGRVGGVGLDLEDVQQPLEIGIRLVERMQRLGSQAPRLTHREQLFDSGAARPVQGIDGESLPKSLESTLPVVLSQPAHLADSRENLDL